ncbi:MAG: PEPxxWA-CTERM sorting domain-containing protein [Phenylobacterium sp.]|uniref:PEPxxWA-CTERM sorting domain-containing protein n=1 Tax=Phenylobacterium sp. TaxID=1871053 RepID=UPI001A5FDF79|nr:PEPxxWA-CTERM sorting domain-containing protein [Phenylobacterium sp.]MBL8554884.1 PEPxxWA-CTERM sorting domain-containing protein [Phenylobacterium sp.]
MRTLLVAAAAALSLAPAAAHADYFVTAVANLGSASDGGYAPNGPTSKSASVAGGAAQATVDLATGQARTYLSFYGPDVAGPDFGSTGAVFGDTVTFSGATNAKFKFNFDGSVYSDPIEEGNLNTYQILLVANLRVFQAGSGATSSNFASYGGALVSDSFVLEIRNPTETIDRFLDESLFGSTAVTAGGSYDVFASFSTAIAMNGQPVFAELDFLNTATFGIELDDPGVSYSAQSGVLVGSTPSGAVPEPSTWALMILGFGGAGALLRRERRQPAI